MKIYVGQTRSTKLIQALHERGWGEMTVRGELPPRRTPWAYDNGAFRDHEAGRPFDFVRWTRDLWKMRNCLWDPKFIVIPDVVGDGRASMARSLEWLDWVPEEIRSPRLLAVQDGMEEAEVAEVLPRFGGIFVGGSVPWKVRTGARWVRLAHEHALLAHVGQVGPADRVRWAMRIGADSIDTCLPLFSEENLERFERALQDPQIDLL